MAVEEYTFSITSTIRFVTILASTTIDIVEILTKCINFKLNFRRQILPAESPP